jgi:AcrR family transcriptional regulator
VPKIVDHEQRRWELVRAVWSVIRERGVEGASVRAVARQAGWSPSSVQYYFASQAELLTFAVRAMSEVADRRLAEPGLPDDPRDRALTQLERLLPLDPDAYVATEIWLAFLARVLIDNELRALNRADHDRLGGLCRELLGELAAAGRMNPEADLDLEASRLHALFDGVCLHAVTEPDRMPPDRVRQIMRHHLDTLGPLPTSG